MEPASIFTKQGLETQRSSLWHCSSLHKISTCYLNSWRVVIKVVKKTGTRGLSWKFKDQWNMHKLVECSHFWKGFASWYCASFYKFQADMWNPERALASFETDRKTNGRIDGQVAERMKERCYPPVPMSTKGKYIWNVFLIIRRMSRPNLPK